MNKSQQKPDLDDILYRCIQKVATGPGYSKSLSQEDARDALLTILDGSADPVRAGVFLIALRMKRESIEENKGFLEALIQTTNRVTADIDSVIDISEPYNGYVRGLSVTAFLAPLLAEMGEAAYSHGVESVGPKFGLTHHKILKSIGINVDISVEDAAKQLANSTIGWAYIDQKAINPSLHNLVDLRERLIKRSALTTTESLLKPISGGKETLMVCGYVHSEYPAIYAELGRFSGFDSAAIIRGVEGGITPSLQQQGKYFGYHNLGEESLVELDPKSIGINVKKRAIPLPDNLPEPSENDHGVINADAASAAAAKEGLAALTGQAGMAYDSLLYNASIVLLHRKRYKSLIDAADAVSKVLHSGSVIQRLKSSGAKV
ncbi:MAG: anthranilate phosphoribosyltransferase [Cocleimonas sp.]|jgi:anthranilate phosphoribosyltransferase